MIVFFLLLFSTAEARVFLSTAEALNLAFPGCEIEPNVVYLTDVQRVKAAELSGTELRSSVVQQHVGLCDGQVAGTAYFDTHRVRTLQETLMVVVSPSGTLVRIEVLSFREPAQYLPPLRFFEQFRKKALSEQLSYRRASLRRVSGATLTCTAVLKAARRSLALHRVISEPS